MRDCKFKKGSEGSEKSLKNFPYPYKTSNAGGDLPSLQVLSSGFHLFLFLLFGLGPVAIAFGLVSFADLLLLDFVVFLCYTRY